MGESSKLTRKKRGGWHGYQKHDRKIHPVALPDMAVIPGLCKNFFIVAQALQKHFQVKSESKVQNFNKT